MLDSVFVMLFTWFNQNGRLVRHQVVTDLEHIHPAADKQKICLDFYVSKLKKSLLIGIGGIAIGILLIGKTLYFETGLDLATKRGGVFEESRTVKLKGEYEGGNNIFELEILPVQLSDEECEAYYQQFCNNALELIAGENDSMQHVETDLLLKDRYEEYPFTVEWRSLNPDVISSSGEVQLQDTCQNVILRGTLSYGNFEENLDLEITVAEKNDAGENFDERLGQLLLKAEQDSRDQENIVLPQKLDGKEIRWSIPKDNIGYFICAGAIALSVLIFFMSDKDLHDEWEKKKKDMKREYADIVYKLALYMGAGMTIQGAFQRLSSKYEQILYACRELKSGIAEAVVYEHLGRRIGLPEYVKLGTLLSQNLKRGSNLLLDRLCEEANHALTEKIQIGRKLGEEASTKLLVPMVMMLAVVMIMVMFPAFSSMGM